MDIKIDLSGHIINTDRLILRAFIPTDLEDFYTYAKIKGLGEMAGWKAHKSINESEKILDEFIKNKDVFAIVYKENMKVIGSLGLHPVTKEYPDNPNQKSKELGYVLHKDYWNKGLMTEAVIEAIKFAFNTLKLDLLFCGHFVENIRSRRVIEKCGFAYLSNEMYYAKQLDKDKETIKYFLSKDQYEKVRL